MTCWQGAACAEEAHGPLGAAANGLALKPEGIASEASAGACGGSAADACSTRARSPEVAPEPDADEPDWAGAADLQRYEVMHVIGTGVYGTVFVARDRETDGRVAIKSLTIDDAQGDGVPAHVIREVSLLRDFVHPNIVELKDLQVNGPTEYQLIFEYVPDDLHRILKGHRREGTQLLMEEVLRYSQDLLNGIHACHARMIIHRDLKPQNLLIHPVDGLKICDFGLARIFSFPVQSYTKRWTSGLRGASSLRQPLATRSSLGTPRSAQSSRSCSYWAPPRRPPGRASRPACRSGAPATRAGRPRTSGR
ncbi:unnamed protein product [Prorocentrum cordatum]|uniref:Cyclin-dependent kinase 2 homolog n=1 Tax=Prorocentrum cordatum TaxID=2364126 RepID=A0ABN9U2E6_9DINO|nr:unnamed protein product [Polarella glacialis]